MAGSTALLIALLVNGLLLLHITVGTTFGRLFVIESRNCINGKFGVRHCVITLLGKMILAFGQAVALHVIVPVVFGHPLLLIAVTVITTWVPSDKFGTS